MKKLIVLFAAIVMIACFSNSVNAQNVITATQTDAYIVTPLSVTLNHTLDFGKLAIMGASGVCVITPVATPTRTSTNGVNLVTSPWQNAYYTVHGEATFTYDITLPAQPGITVNGPSSSTMIVDNFVSTPATTGTIGGAGSEDVYVGATLHVSSGQTPGAYLGSFNFIVNYN
ncbi:MAG: DUF4402 domain-containing protein [Bacteroidetes bacterium]|nr:DUF4402 domain-containing protein [Bacteroidota bacterium]